MPEGQVSHRNALRLGTALAGRTLSCIEAPDPRLAPQRIPARLAGDRVARAEARGKHHLLRFESGRTLHTHLMMRGVWRVLPASATLRRTGLVLALHTPDHLAALYRATHVRLLERSDPEPRWLRSVGPDLLGADVDPVAATEVALRRCDPAREVGEALMDQRLVAGIGNVYKSEACFLAGVDPWRPVGSLRSDEARALGAIASRLLAEGVRQRRIETYPPPGGHPFGVGGKWVYGRRGAPCRRCGTPIRSRGQGDANRATYWCPACQA